MWGIRAIQVAALLYGAPALVALVGCQNMWSGDRPLIESRDQSIAPRNLGAQETPDDSQPVVRRRFFDDQPKHLTPERVHGGIY
jgi:hypothetical protein